MIEVGIGKCIGSRTANQEEGLSSKEGVKLFFICCQGLGGFYKCNNGCLSERTSIIVGCYVVGLEAFL